MNHRTYDSQRYSPLEKINKDNVKDLKLAYAVAIGGTAANENLELTPLAEDGFLYVVDQWGVLYKIDGRSGKAGRIVWRMDPGQENVPLANRGAALWGNLVVTVANYPPRIIATDKETGKVKWETSLDDGQADVQLTAAPLAVKDKIILGAAGGDRGVRDFIVALDAATGKLVWRKYTVPAPGEPGSETWKDKNNAWQTGGGAMWVTGCLRHRYQSGAVGHRKSGADVQSVLPPGKQSLHQQPDLVGSRQRQDELVLPVHAGRHVGLRRGRHSHSDRRPGGRPGAQARRPFGTKRLLLRARTRQWAARAGEALCRHRHLDQGHRSKDRIARRL